MHTHPKDNNAANYAGSGDAIWVANGLYDVGGSNRCVVSFNCSGARLYDLEHIDSLVTGSWFLVAGARNVTGDVSGTMTLTDEVNSVQVSYRVRVSLP